MGALSPPIQVLASPIDPAQDRPVSALQYFVPTPSTLVGMAYQRPAGTHATDHRAEPRGQGEDYLRRIAEAVERIADAVAGPLTGDDADPLPTFPVIDWDDMEPRMDVVEPHVGRSSGRLYYAVCPRCPEARGKPADPAEPSTWLEHGESSYDLDEQFAALARHLAHHEKLADPAAALPIWTWSDHPCPRCHAAAEQECRTASGRPSTAVHSARWRDHSPDYW